MYLVGGGDERTRKELNTIMANQLPDFLLTQNTKENRVFVRVELPKFEIESHIQDDVTALLLDQVHHELS